MCPFCFANLAFITASAVSTSRLGALAVKKFFFEPNRNRHPKKTGERQDENGDIRTENRHGRNESV